MPTPWPFEKSYEDSVGQGHKDDHEVELEARCKMISPVEFQEVLVLVENSQEMPCCIHLSHEKNPPTFYYTGWLIGILIIYYNALYNWVV